MRSDIIFVVAYRCPRCQAALEGRADRAHSWLRCPKCGRASLPPEHAVRPVPVPERLAPGEDVLVIGPSPEPRPMTPVAVAPWPERPRPAARPRNGWRMVYATVLFVSMTMLLFSYLDRNTLGSSVFSALALLALVLLALPSRS